MGRKPTHFSCLSWSNKQTIFTAISLFWFIQTRAKFMQTDVRYSMPEQGNASHTT